MYIDILIKLAGVNIFMYMDKQCVTREPQVFRLSLPMNII